MYFSTRLVSTLIMMVFVSPVLAVPAKALDLNGNDLSDTSSDQMSSLRGIEPDMYWEVSDEIADIGANDPHSLGWLSHDQLRLYYPVWKEGSALDFYLATRSTPEEPFTTSVEIPELNSSISEGQAALSIDELEIVFIRNSSGYWESNQLFYARRDSTSEPFSTPVLMDEVALDGVGEGYPCLSADGLTLYYTGIEFDTIVVATRSDRESPFDNPVKYDDLPDDMNLLSFYVHPDGRHALGCQRSDQGMNVISLSRNSTAGPFSLDGIIEGVTDYTSFQAGSRYTGDYTGIYCYYANGSPSLMRMYRRKLNDQLEFNHETEAGWLFEVPAPFDERTSGSLVSGSLAIDTEDNQFTFGFWKSPVVLLSNGVAPMGPTSAAALKGAIEEDSFILCEFDISNNLLDQSLSPTVRLRATEIDFSRSDMLVFTSMGTSEFSPSQIPRTYRQVFETTQRHGAFEVYFDVLNFMADNATSSSTYLESSRIEVMDKTSLNDEIIELSETFSEGGLENWGFFNAEPQVVSSGSDFTTSSLALFGNSERAGEFQLGIFSRENTQDHVQLQTGRLYEVSFQVSTNYQNTAELPTFRLRVNTDNDQAASIINLESEGTDPILPTPSESQVYKLYLIADPGVAGHSLIPSIDYIFTPGQDTDLAASIELEQIVIKSYSLDSE